MGIIVIDPPPPPPPPPRLQRMAPDEWKEVWEYCFNIAQTTLASHDTLPAEEPQT